MTSRFSPVSSPLTGRVALGACGGHLPPSDLCPGGWTWAPRPPRRTWAASRTWCSPGRGREEAFHFLCLYGPHPVDEALSCLLACQEHTSCGYRSLGFGGAISTCLQGPRRPFPGRQWVGRTRTSQPWSGSFARARRRLMGRARLACGCALSWRRATSPSAGVSLAPTLTTLSCRPKTSACGNRCARCLRRPCDRMAPVSRSPIMPSCTFGGSSRSLRSSGLSGLCVSRPNALGARA